MSENPIAPQMQLALLSWYQSARRPLPWRENHDPYRIWISEVMLQQTTVAAVIPYYLRFLNRFPNLEALASAAREDVLELWSGLGYYSRARNLHKAAQEIQSRSAFPQSYVELLEIAGFGPYTARAVSSIAFNESVGVVDGNVIRVLARVHGRNDEWWKPAVRESYQACADSWSSNVSSREMNQALMELGATVCTPKSPACMTCPLFAFCKARQQGVVDMLPRPKPRRDMEIWVWNVQPLLKGPDHVLLVRNEYAPFLKGQWIWPGSVKRAIKKPRSFDYSHTVTHHKIFVQVQKPRKATRSFLEKDQAQLKEFSIVQLKRQIPTALILKALPFLSERNELRLGSEL